MSLPAIVRWAKRIGVIAAALVAIGSLGYAAISAAVKTDATEERVDRLERRERAGYARDQRMDAKLDILLSTFGVRVPEHLRAPPVADEPEVQP